MRMPGFTAEASLLSHAGQPYRESGCSSGLGRMAPVAAQLGIGFGGGGGVAYPPDDDDCYCCTQWVRCPCGLSIA